MAATGAHGLAKANIEFYATDPRIYLNTLQDKTVFLSSGGGGLTFDATPSFTSGGLPTGGRTTATNQGTFATYPTFFLFGPLTNPVIENESTGETFEATITIADGDYLLVDTSRRTALYDRTASRYSTLTSASQWFDQEPGDNDLRFRAATSEEGYLTVQWRSAYV